MAGWPLPLRLAAVVEESPGSTERRCRVTPGESDLRDSATESRPPAVPGPSGQGAAVRVKGCGKSAPRGRQRHRHGKPHREQDHVGGWGRATGPGAFSAPDSRVGRARRPATGVPEEWSSRGGNALDRTRLTGRLALINLL